MNKILFLFLVLLIFVKCETVTYKQGERLYDSLCSNCHMPDGKGLNKLIPDLSNKINSLNEQSQVCVIIKGVNADSLGSAMKAMPAFDLKPAELTNLINYINHRWRNDFAESSIIQISKYQSMCTKQK